VTALDADSFGDRLRSLLRLSLNGDGGLAKTSLLYFIPQGTLGHRVRVDWFIVVGETECFCGGGEEVKGAELDVAPRGEC
jgi:hypothetical protein